MKHITNTILILALLLSTRFGAGVARAQTAGTLLVWGNTFNNPVPDAVQSGVSAIAGGMSCAMALKPDGSVVVWGRWAYLYGLPNVPLAAQSGVTAIAAGVYHCLALKNDGSVVAWGMNGAGQTTVPVVAQSGVTAIAAGGEHSLALKSDGSVVAWGDNSQGQTNVPAAAQSGVIGIAAGDTCSLALKTNGTVVAWGSGFGSQVPAGLSGVKSIAPGMALKNDGTVVVWGIGANVPVNVQGRVKGISPSGDPIVIITNGSIVAWGDNPYSQTDVPYGLAGVTAVASGTECILALYVPTPPAVVVPPTGQTVSAWQSASMEVQYSGYPVDFQWRRDGVDVGSGGERFYLDYAQTNDSGLYTVVISNFLGCVTSSPPAVLTVNPTVPGTVVQWWDRGPYLTGVSAIAAGLGHLLALKYDGSVVAWGDNGYGQTDVPVEARSGVRVIGAGLFHSLAVKTNGAVVSWGSGQTNVPLAAQSGVVAVAGSYGLSVALKNDGSVLEWNSAGQINVPVEAQSGVTAIAAGDGHVLVLKNDGSVFAWGYNIAGQTNVPVAAQSGVIAIAAGVLHSVALKNDGSVVAWGDNSLGQTDVPAEAQSGVIAISAQYYETLALKSNGTVVAWGVDGWLNPASWGVPAGLKGVIAIAAGGVYSLALVSGTPAFPVPLALRRSGNAMILSWPSDATGFTLQSTLSLTPPVAWVDVSNNPPAVVGGQFTVTNPISGPAQFFRLRKL